MYAAARPGSPPDTKLTWLEGITLLGQHLDSGTWVLLCPKDKKDPSTPRLAVIESLFRVDQAGYLYVSVVTAPLEVDDDGLRHVSAQTVKDTSVNELVDLNLYTATVLYCCKHDGQLRFIELP
jgi:hypothetical protein